MKSKYLKSSRLKKKKKPPYFETNNFDKFQGNDTLIYDPKENLFIFQCVVQICLEYPLCIYSWEYLLLC